MAMNGSDPVNDMISALSEAAPVPIDPSARTSILRELPANGEEEARELGPSLRAIRFSRVLTSPLLRARRTWELAGLKPPADIEPDLAEWDYGDYEGMRSVDIRH